MSPAVSPDRRCWRSDFDHREHKRLPRDDLRRYFAMSGSRVNVMGTEPARPRFIVIPNCDKQMDELPEGLKHARVNTIATDFEGCNAPKRIMDRVKELQGLFPHTWREQLDVEPGFPLNHREWLSDAYFAGQETQPKARVLSIGNCEGMAAVVDFWRTSSITQSLYDFISCTDNGQKCMVWALNSEVGWWDKCRMAEAYGLLPPKSWVDIQETIKPLRIDNLKLKPNLVGYTGIELAKISTMPKWMSFSNQQFSYIENMRLPLDYIYYCALDVALPQLQLAREYSYRHRYACDFINPEDPQQVWKLLEDEKWGNTQPAYITHDGFRDMRESERKWLKRWLSFSEADQPNPYYPKRFKNKQWFVRPLRNAYVVDPYLQELHPIEDIDLEAENALWPQFRFYTGSDWEQRQVTYGDLWVKMDKQHLDLNLHLQVNPDYWSPIQHVPARPDQTSINGLAQSSTNPSQQYCAYFVSDDFLQVAHKTKIPEQGSIREKHELRYMETADRNPMTLQTIYTAHDAEYLCGDVDSRNAALYRTEERRQRTRNEMRPPANRLRSPQIRTRILRNTQPYIGKDPSVVDPADKAPTYGPRCALPRQCHVPTTADCDKFLADERARRLDRASTQYTGPSRSKSIYRDNRPSYNTRQRPKMFKSKYPDDPDIGEPGSCSWEAPTNCGRNRDPTAGRSTSPMEPLESFVDRWQATSRPRSPSPTNSGRRSHSVYQSRLVEYHYDDDDAGSTDEAITQTLAMPHGTVPLSPASSIPVTPAATDDSDCVMVAIHHGSMPPDAASSSHPHAQPVVDILSLTHDHVLPVSDQQLGSDAAPSVRKAAKLALPRRSTASRRGRGRGRGKDKPNKDEPHPDPGNAAVASLPPIYADTVVRTLNNEQRIDEQDFELEAATTRIEQLERAHQQLAFDQQQSQAAYQLLFNHAAQQNMAQAAIAAPSAFYPPHPQLQLSMTPSQLAIAGPMFNQQQAPPSQYAPVQHMQMDDPNQPSTSQQRSSVMFQPIEPAPVTAVTHSSGADTRQPRSILRQPSQTRHGVSDVPSSSVTFEEMSSTPHVASSDAASSSSQQQQAGSVPPGVSHLEALQQALPAIAANPRTYRNAAVQAEERDVIYPDWFGLEIYWPADPPLHRVCLFDLHQALVDGPTAFNNDVPVVPVLRFFVYSGPAPDGDTDVSTPSYMERIGREVAVQLRNLAHARFTHGMITTQELFNILLNANVCFEHRFRAHQQLGYPNSLAYAACLQASRIKFHIVKKITSNQGGRNFWLALPKKLLRLLPMHEIQLGYTNYMKNVAPELGRKRMENFWQLRTNDRLGDPTAFRALCDYYYTLQRTTGILGRLNHDEMISLNHRRGIIEAHVNFILPELNAPYIDANAHYFYNHLHEAHEDPHGFANIPPPPPYVPEANNNNANIGQAPFPEDDAPGQPLPGAE